MSSSDDPSTSSAALSTSVVAARAVVTNETVISDILEIGRGDVAIRTKASAEAAAALAAVSVRPEDVSSLAAAFGISSVLAERELKKVGGVIGAAAKALTAAETTL